jgi:acetylornithine deacetylase/succinyl-diaminopimelate desuccinylase-like protein
LTQTITTELYTKSHVDLLVEEVSPYTPTPVPEDSDMVLDLAMAYTGDETRDGGQTPGPFEEMRRRMTNLATETPILSPRLGGIRKRKRKEKKRKWVWTIGQEDEETESGAIASLCAATGEASTPLTAVKISVEQAESESDLTTLSETETDEDRMVVEMSDTSSLHSSRATTPYSTDLDMKTPTVPTAAKYSMTPTLSSSWSSAKKQRLASVDLTNSETGSRRDTPIPPDLVECMGGASRM